MFFEPPTLTAEDATAFPTAADSARVTLNRATRRQLQRDNPLRKALRRQERPFRRAFRGIYSTRDRLAAARVAEARS